MCRLVSERKLHHRIHQVIHTITKDYPLECIGVFDMYDEMCKQPPLLPRNPAPHSEQIPHTSPTACIR